MTKDLYRYKFSRHVPIEEIEAALLLGFWGAESLHGEAQVRLDARHFLNSDRRACVIDGGTAVGQTLSRLFAGYLHREFGADAFRVDRVERDQRDTGLHGDGGPSPVAPDAAPCC